MNIVIIVLLSLILLMLIILLTYTIVCDIDFKADYEKDNVTPPLMPPLSDVAEACSSSTPSDGEHYAESSRLY